MQAVILAGGLGTRLRPLTYEIPKPLVPVLGRPFLHYILEMLSENGVDDVVLCVGHLGQTIVDSVGDGGDFGLKVRYSFEKELLDTGGAIKNAAELLRDEFLVLNGDTLQPIDYRELVEYWETRGKGCDGLIVVYKNEDKIVPNNVRVDETGRITEYMKQGFEGPGYVDGGVQIFRKSVFDEIPTGRKVSLEREIYPRVIENGRMLSYITSTRYYDIGTPERIRVFEEYLGKRKAADGE